MLDQAILDRLREAASIHFPSFAILAAYVHGSRVSGRPQPTSDLDVGYYLDGYREGTVLPLREEMGLASMLSDVTGFEVDLRNLADAPLEVRGRALEEGIRIFSGHDVRRVALERDLLGRYHDYKDVFREMHRVRLRRHTGSA
jgi:predicted nucleotidyltransferase